MSAQYPVYPRACGGTERIGEPSGTVTGLSPRVRGNRHIPAQVGAGHGSIPARAGEPDALHAADFANEVYPRACGGTAGPVRRLSFPPGLSPRVRGNHIGSFSVAVRDRSIPARAGEPPGVPGNQVGFQRGSIPARAGEPGSRPP